MGESVTEGTVARWVKAVGDTVREGETVVEVTTDKVDVEVPAPAAGRLEQIVVDEGVTVEVGATLALITSGVATNGEVKPPAGSGGGQAPVAAAAPQPAPVIEEPPAPPAEVPPAPPIPADEGIGLNPIATPLARRRAVVDGVDVTRVDGSGPEGLVRSGDVRRGEKAPAVAATVGATPPAGPVAPPRPAAPATTPRPARTPVAPAGAEILRGPAAALVEYMERSRELPTATSFRTISVRTMDNRRRELNSALVAANRRAKVSFTHLIGYAIARAAREMPEMTAHFARTAEGKPARVPGGTGLGIAVDSLRPDGSRFLIVPVIARAGERDFADFRDEYERLIERARTNSLSADDLRGASITLTNPGGLGTVASVSRLLPEQAAIIAVGAIGYPAEWRGVDDARVRQLGVAKVMTMTSTYDHRVIQGAQSGEFLGRIESLLDGADSFYDEIFAALGVPPPAAEQVVESVAIVAAPVQQTGVAGTLAPDRQLLAAMQAATSLVKAHRTHGHLGAHLDPLGTRPIGDPAMDPETYGLTPELMRQIPADLLRVYVPGRTLADVLPALRRTYCGTIAFEIEHISSHEERVWLREHIESGAYRLPFSPEQRIRLLGRLTKVDAMERYLRRTFIGQKTFSIEGLDAMVPMLEELLTLAADYGIHEAVMGMAHRGRLAVTAHVANRPYEAILNAFEVAAWQRPGGDVNGDVKYHQGTQGTYLTHTGRAIAVRLLANPSHLEAVDPVVEGWTRAEQTQRHAATLHLERSAAMAVLIHGDAAFVGQGVVAETLNLQALAGYSTAGTVHLISDNQLGFTTPPDEARSTRHASDMAKGFDIPIVHVNADDIEACESAIHLAFDYRKRYQRDVVVHLIGYRRFGHNETDEPAYTQPLMYRQIKEHPTVREIYAKQLVDQGIATQAEVDRMNDEAYERVAAAHRRVKANLVTELDTDHQEARASSFEDITLPTRVDAAALHALDDELLSFPDGFAPHQKLMRQMDRRKAAFASGPIDWGTSEALAFATLLVDGHPIRLTGQDTVRGTFSQRHLEFHDETTGEEWIPMQHLRHAQATFEVHNSPLSEVACLGFEYGYSACDPETFVIWEAQYGDFVNGAQVITDQFIVSSRDKWGHRSRLTLLLPHGYEGSGPEHSSARIERFLQLSAHGNIRVANCSTAAQYFHLLRNQGLSTDPRPLVIFTPKQLLRLPEAAATLAELSEDGFHTVLDDPTVGDRHRAVTTLLLCTGRIYYDLSLHSLRSRASDLAIARVELLHPLPVDDITHLIESYPNLEHIYWVQEEPRNMGAWPHVELRLGLGGPMRMQLEYLGRPRRSSPSEGYSGSHKLEQERLITEAMITSKALREGALASVTRDRDT
ncbi:MAG: multifunctional oxoglutarate decarboxylase/oxoglutarate dehydrogenase thiamine pyrophosphate-binding subunit/dihydrolipoyllysine-residue succinyltransferase subunit [Candidatus Dormibacteraeota bacterium]|nr:multifunctional oxoglutarate decarboxylase/oxoglutarate dehydrogenase thiamine pyrophosphate-binding subunit/dihydrolipoyllysine-residue succinyltransferase subunit [Candidatus Dormibacteraeota bacterium]